MIDALASTDCRLILNEVYECSDVTRLLARGDQLFALLPDPNKRPAVSDISPNNRDLLILQRKAEAGEEFRP